MGFGHVLFLLCSYQVKGAVNVLFFSTTIEAITYSV